jgi:ketosteroid isomerase-like protein
MPERAADVVLAMWAAFAAGDLDGGFGFFGPQVEWHGTVGGLTEGDTNRGQDQTVAGFADMLQDWSSYVVELHGLLEAPGGEVVAFVRESMAGRTSGLETTTESALIFTVADGAVVRVRPFLDAGKAVAVAGLDPSAQPEPVSAGAADFGRLGERLRTEP